MKITEKQIPDQVAQKVKALVVEMGFLETPIRDCEAREIVAAALNAWQNAEDSKYRSCAVICWNAPPQSSACRRRESDD